MRTIYLASLQVLDSYESTLDEQLTGDPYEHSELLLYKAQVMDEGGKQEEALKLLDSSKVCLAEDLW